MIDIIPKKMLVTLLLKFSEKDNILKNFKIRKTDSLNITKLCKEVKI